MKYGIKLFRLRVTFSCFAANKSKDFLEIYATILGLVVSVRYSYVFY